MMFGRPSYDAVVVGSGPNGLSAAIALAQAGRSVVVVERADTFGGGARSAELTLPGFVHDSCAAIMPLAVASPFLSSLPLADYGLDWIYSPGVVAHPLDGGQAVLLDRSLECTAERLGADGQAYRAMLQPILDDWENFRYDLLGPLPLPPRSMLTYIRFGLNALASATGLARSRFESEAVRGVFAGLAGHSQLDLDVAASGAVGIVIALTAHAVGWPLPRGGAQAFSGALAGYLKSQGGEIVTGVEVNRMEDLPNHRAAIFDVSPRSLVGILGERLPPGYRRQLERYRYGVGVCKVDYALDGPIPWRAEACCDAATIHLGPNLEDIRRSEHDASHGRHTDKPYVLVGQQSLFDPSRAPDGRHTVWAYCHVPNGSNVDMSDRIEAQIERFAPGFRDRILAKHVRTASEMAQYNPNYVGGDINTGVQDLFQMFTRPAVRLNPYTTPIRNVFLCSSATPPGGGVHGMSGYYAAKAALDRVLK
jgi:phytoene dehydrogenase-like protein